MPEGDTIFRAAARMQQALAGKEVLRFATVLPALARVDEDAPLAGRTIERVFSMGKHLLVEFSEDLFLRTHMRMNGSWHLYRPGERWKRRRGDMRIEIETAEFVAVGFSIPVAELLSSRELARQPDLRAIGPDLLGATFDREEALRRIRARGELEIAEALLNQRLIAGIGNVFKSEILFVAGVNPFTRVAGIDDVSLRKIIEVSERLLRWNAGESRGQEARRERITTARLDPRYQLWVYGRGGKPCQQCGTAVERARQGRDARSTYWCPKCQAGGDTAPL